MTLSIRSLAVLVTAFVLAGCIEKNTADDGDLDPSGGGDETTLSLSAFSVEGSYEPRSDGTVPITPSMDEGKFTMEWSVEGFDADDELYEGWGYNYYVPEAFLSEDDVIDEDDLSVFWARCGDPDYTCTHEGVQTQTCYFRNDPAIACYIGQTDGDDLYWRLSGADGLDAFLADGLPKAAYIIMKVCDALYTECTSQAVPVEFQ